MPKVPPPASCPGTPVRRLLKKGTLLWRIHESKFGAADFNPTPASDPWKGGRFDSPDGSYHYLYAAESKAAAVAEVPADKSARIIPRAQVRDRVLSKIELGVDLEMVELHGPHLGQFGQDAWLTKCDSSEYGLTREWALAIRCWVPGAAGFRWRSKRDEDWFVYVFFHDRQPSGAIIPKGRRQWIDFGRGLDSVQKILARHNVVIS